MKIAVVCAPGVGDAVIMHIASFHLAKNGHDVTTVTPHRFGKWLEGYKFENDLNSNFDAIFLQHDNKPKSFEIREKKMPVYTFFGAYKESKHGPKKAGLDYICNLDLTMVDNVGVALRELFHLKSSTDNGFRAPPNLIHRKYSSRVAIHASSGDPHRNWDKFDQVANLLRSSGLAPEFLPQFPTLEELTSFIYESGYFIGNDSGPGHIASLLKIPHLIIGKEEKHLRHWRPGWGYGGVVVPPKWLTNFKFLRNRWKRFITTKSVIKTFYDIIKVR